MALSIDISGAYAVYSASGSVGAAKVATIRRQVENNQPDTYDLTNEGGNVLAGAVLNGVPPAAPTRYVLSTNGGWGNGAVSVVGRSVQIAWPGAGGKNGAVWVRLD